MSDFNDIALAAARERGLTPADVRAMSFAAVCWLAGADTSGKGPAGFSWEGLRELVAASLQAELDDRAGAALVGAVAAAVLGLQEQPLVYEAAIRMAREFVAPAMLPAAQAALAGMGVSL